MVNSFGRIWCILKRTRFFFLPVELLRRLLLLLHPRIAEPLDSNISGLQHASSCYHVLRPLPDPTIELCPVYDALALEVRGIPRNEPLPAIGTLDKLV